jgi:hypothetical protein
MTAACPIRGFDLVTFWLVAFWLAALAHGARAGFVRDRPGSHLAEVVPVLDPHEKAVFDGLVTQLRANDPRFAHRVDRMCRPKQRLYQVMAILLWTMAPLCIVFGGWTGVIMAVVGSAYGAHLMTRRGGARQTLWSTTRRPRTSSS